MIFQKYTIKNYVFISLLLVFLNGSLSSFSQNKIINYAKEKIYLHLDKPSYYPGEVIWFKAYLVDNNTHSSKALSKVVYIELIAPNDSIAFRKTIKNTDSGAYGDFKLSSQLKTGHYTIRAYTNYMRNFDQAYFFRKIIFIKSLKSDVIDIETEETSNSDVQFFPEGGNLVNGFLNTIGFKAIDGNGNGIDVKGIIFDNLGNKISKFESSNLGMGVFQFIPKQGNTYKARILYKQKESIYNLPKVLSSGVLIKVIEHTDYYGIYLESSIVNGLYKFTLSGAQRNSVLFSSKIESKETQIVVKVPKSILKEGIVQFTLFDNNSKPLLERLVFYETGETEVQLKINPSKEQYQTRDLVALELLLDPRVSNEVRANMSIAVTDMSSITYQKYGLDIKSQLLLNSELKGEIEQPGYYFHSDHPKRKKHLDILMMTQGWRQFIINDTLNKKTFALETGISLSGTIKKSSNHHKSVEAEVSLTYNNTKETAFESIVTGTNGYFIFKNLDFIDSTSVILQAKKYNLTKEKKTKNKGNSFHIELDSFLAPEMVTRQHLFKYVKDKFLETSRSNQYIQSLVNFERESEQLDEVLLKSVYNSERKYDYNKKRLLYKEATNTIDFRNIGPINTENPLSVLRGRVPGLRYVGIGDEKVRGIYLRGASSFSKEGRALLLVDGIPVGNDAEDIAAISANDILFIDILKGYRATIYGSRGSNGVVAVYTKNGSKESGQPNNYRRKGIINFIHPGYSQARKFYEPTYNATNKNATKVDYRSTIYWNPVVQINGKNKVIISFYTADNETIYKIDIEGITSEGQIIKAASKIYVK